MTAPSASEAVLSREELAALLESLGEELRDGGEVWRPEAVPDSSPRLVRVLEEFTASESKRLSALFQCRIVFDVVSLQRVSHDDWAALLLPEDRVAEFSIEPDAGSGFLLLSRPLFFAWMCADMGSRPAARPKSYPSRRYSRIESRLYGRIAETLLESLGGAWPQEFPTNLEMAAVVSPERLQEMQPEGYELATIDVSGFGEVLRMRIAIPQRATRGPARSEAATPPPELGVARRNLETHVRDLPVPIRVELGVVELALSELAGLKVGQTLPLAGGDLRRLTVRVDGRPRFHAMRGSVGERLAVQIAERIGSPT